MHSRPGWNQKKHNRSGEKTHAQWASLNLTSTVRKVYLHIQNGPGGTTQAQLAKQNYTSTVGQPEQK